MTTLDPLPFGYEDLSSSVRLELALRFADLMGKSPRRWSAKVENHFRHFAGWYIDLQKIGRVFARMDSKGEANVRSGSG